MLIHIVKPGESLWQISNYYGVPPARIMDVNGLPNANQLVMGEALVIPTNNAHHAAKPKPVIDVNGYVYDEGLQNAAAVMRETGKDITFLSPFAHGVREDGSLEPLDDATAINAAHAERAVPMMVIANFTTTEPGSKLAHVILSSTDIQDKLLANMLSIMKQKGYSGVNFDFENVLPADRELYNQFLQRAAGRLHKEHFFISSALPPKTSGGQQDSSDAAYDYAAHGRILDFVILMTYEWGYRFGPPQSISPLNEIRRVLDYAVSVIPRNKTFFGFLLYARDWLLPHVKGQEAETFSMQEARARALKHSAAIRYDPVSQTPFFRYRDEHGRMHEVWFEDARSAQAKFNTVKAYGLRGISYWALGFPFPQNWALLEDNFTVRKLF